VDDLENVYNTYFKDVFLYVKALSKDEHIAEDITSETFLKAIKAIDTFDELVIKSNGISTEKLLLNFEATTKIHEVLKSLGDPYREVFSLRIFSELSFKEIADLLGKNENWACVTYHRAKNKIREQMEDYK
jgi:DNA-directed RNA polymerase specialized sigma24 family protein